MITEDQLEQLAIQWFQDTGWNYVHGAVIAPEGVAAEAVRRLNPKQRASSRPSPTGRRRQIVVEEVVHMVRKPVHPWLVQSNREFHDYLVTGILMATHQQSSGRFKI